MHLKWVNPLVTGVSLWFDSLKFCTKSIFEKYNNKNILKINNNLQEILFNRTSLPGPAVSFAPALHARHIKPMPSIMLFQHPRSSKGTKTSLSLILVQFLLSFLIWKPKRKSTNTFSHCDSELFQIN